MVLNNQLRILFLQNLIQLIEVYRWFKPAVAQTVTLVLTPGRSVENRSFAFRSVLLLLFIFELYIRFCLLQTVKCYQHYAKEETRRRCMCIPSCSEYAIICLEKIFPLAIALMKIRIRLYKTCRGEDYKLDFPLKNLNFEFEKKHLN